MRPEEGLMDEMILGTNEGGDLYIISWLGELEGTMLEEEV
jgi:hypothetical protein